jgi:hypothetical protein
MTSPNKNDGYREKINRSINDSLQKIIKPEHWKTLNELGQKYSKLNKFQIIGVWFAFVVLVRFSIGWVWLIFLIWACVCVYVLWTEKPWDKNSFKTFVVYRHPSGELQAVKQGWSWPATFFIFIWTLIKRMWVLSALLIVSWLLYLNANYEDPSPSMNFFDFIEIMSSILLGILGNFWYEKKLLDEGFQRMNTVTAKSKKGALAAYLNQIEDKK